MLVFYYLIKSNKQLLFIVLYFNKGLGEKMKILGLIVEYNPFHQGHL